ncbi:hypothetical protein D3C79_991550 [compost metagenome]
MSVNSSGPDKDRPDNVEAGTQSSIAFNHASPFVYVSYIAFGAKMINPQAGVIKTALAII